MSSDAAVGILKRERFMRCLASILSGPSDQLIVQVKEQEKLKMRPRFLAEKAG
jgi:hypothetical protein